LAGEAGAAPDAPTEAAPDRLKRLLDLTLALPAAVVLAAPMALIALAVRATLGPPVLFRQVRPGYLERPFTLYKFRTMRNATDAGGAPLPDADRLTRFGRLLRATSLDELPSLYNVLRGDLSLVGPRPLLMEYLDRYTPRQRRRHEAVPGLTGWAQVNGRNAIGWEHKFEHDVWYVENRSFGLDLKILLLTLVRVVRGSGVSQPGRATVDYFQGTPGEPPAAVDRDG
jgi:lipopolysaccharide/colanic/teichoic acid biosynthesis glycosyltransferase